MNEPQIRAAFHRKRLKHHHDDPATLVLDELGIQHGRYRADIATVNGRMSGYEIKSNDDSLRRLASQVLGYSAVFDRVIIIAGSRHLRNVERLVPAWWGIVSATAGPRGGIHFKTIRRGCANPGVDDLAVCQLLWRAEAQEILSGTAVDRKLLRMKRSILYGLLVDELSSQELRRHVREKIKQRRNWPNPARSSPDDG